jgi:hypothetical protein
MIWRLKDNKRTLPSSLSKVVKERWMQRFCRAKKKFTKWRSYRFQSHPCQVHRHIIKLSSGLRSRFRRCLTITNQVIQSQSRLSSRNEVLKNKLISWSQTQTQIRNYPKFRPLTNQVRLLNRPLASPNCC